MTKARELTRPRAESILLDRERVVLRTDADADHSSFLQTTFSLTLGYLSLVLQ